MAYQENIPQPTDTLQASQSDLLGNFQALKQLIDVNHGTFGSANEGKHTFLTIPDFGGTPVFAGTDIGLYSNTSSLTSLEELFIRPSDGSTNIPLTAARKQETGWSYLPSGILVKWGTGNGNGLTTLTFGVGPNFPAFTTLLAVQITTFDSSTSQVDTFVRLVDFSATQFRVYCSARTSTANAAANFKYLAIGI